VDGRLDRSADVLVDRFAERDGLKLLRPRFFLDTLCSSGGRPARRRVGRALHQPEECATSLFHQTRDTTYHGAPCFLHRVGLMIEFLCEPLQFLTCLPKGNGFRVSRQIRRQRGLGADDVFLRQQAST
jgi:hypothetical protein